MKNKRNNSARFVARAGLIAALYVVLTYITTVIGLSSGAIQIRLSEPLAILPVFLPEAIPGLAIGCLIANLMTPGVAALDLLFGTLATLIGAVGAYLLRKLKPRFIWIATLPNVLANTLILPPVIMFAYGAEQGYLFLLASIFISQALTAGLGGTLLYPIIKKTKLDKLF